MPESIPRDAPAVHRAARNGRSAPSVALGNDLKTRLRWLGVLPATVTAMLGAGAVVWLLVLSTAPVSPSTIVALTVVAAGCFVVLVVAVLQADRVSAGSDQTLDALRVSIHQSQADLQRLYEQLRRGERPTLGQPPVSHADPSDAVGSLQDAVNRVHYAAQVALINASAQGPAVGPGAHVEVFVNLARRLQSLVHRTIQLLDDLENQVEDPDLLKGLFQADHLVTRIRRHAENLAVLGGADSRRQWTTPQALTEVLRSAIAEVEQYSRVKLVPPIEGTLHGHAVADVVHLLAELIENATMFSAPYTTVLLRVQTVAAGLVVEVEDRGLGMSRADQQRVNNLLADPHRIDLAALLRDGRLGLYVVAVIARRHGIAVQLQANIFGGIQAVFVVPPDLLGTPPEEREPRQRTPAQQQAPEPAVRQPVAAMAAHGAASPPVWSPGPAVQPPTVSVPTNSYDAHREAPPAAPEPHRGVVTPASPAATGAARPPAPERATGRPPLPQRTSQAHLAPQLQQPAPPLPDEPTGEHDPQLMAAFRQGFSQAETGADDDGA